MCEPCGPADYDFENDCVSDKEPLTYTLFDLEKMRQTRFDDSTRESVITHAEFTFSLTDAGDHYSLDDSTQFPASRINKPASPTVINEMIAARVAERGQIVANELTKPIYRSEIRDRIAQIVEQYFVLQPYAFKSPTAAAEAVLAQFDVRLKL